MNLYRVISEVLQAKENAIELLPGCWDGPMVPYCIAVLVAAESHSKAKWAAWKSDNDSFNGDPRDMPKMSVRKVKSGIDLAAGDYSGDERFSNAWEN